MNKKIHIDGYKVECTDARGKDKVEFYIGLKSMKNTENMCAHCPERYRCTSKSKGKTRLRFYDFLQRNIKRELPIQIKITRR